MCRGVNDVWPFVPCVPVIVGRRTDSQASVIFCDQSEAVPRESAGQFRSEIDEI
jgi:hypothetical protein